MHKESRSLPTHVECSQGAQGTLSSETNDVTRAWQTGSANFQPAKLGTVQNKNNSSNNSSDRDTDNHNGTHISSDGNGSPKPAYFLVSTDNPNMSANVVQIPRERRTAFNCKENATPTLVTPLKSSQTHEGFRVQGIRV